MFRWTGYGPDKTRERCAGYPMFLRDILTEEVGYESILWYHAVGARVPYYNTAAAAVSNPLGKYPIIKMVY